MDGLKQVRLDSLNKAEALRYMGFGENQPDDNTARLMEECEKKLLTVIKPCYIYRVFDIAEKDGGIEVGGTSLILTGDSVRDHLAGCEKCVFLAATLSAGADMLIRRNEAVDMTCAVITDFLASAAVEQVCDEAEKDITSQLSQYNSTWRFSPGYGDLPLDIQPDFLTVLDAQKRIGLNATANNILTPRKSVTALIGLSSGEISKGRRGCEACSMKDKCTFRKRGVHCG